MDSKQKAKELIEKMYVPTMLGDYRRCALICVDEIIDNIDSKHNGYYVMPDDARKDYDYWEEVKQHILDYD